MPEESTIPDLVERTRAIWVAVNRQDWDAVLSFFAPNAIWACPKWVWVPSRDQLRFAASGRTVRAVMRSMYSVKGTDNERFR
jgi:hypothetical protein